jgi:epoxide hydrolase-like predicted phosphatase
MPERILDAVIFDFGGVLASNGRPSDFSRRFPDHDPSVVQQALMGEYGTDSDHPWHRLERGEITMAETHLQNRAALAELGIVMPSSPEGSGASAAAPSITFTPNGPVIDLVRDLRAAGIKRGVLTNNVREFRDLWRSMVPLDELFDDVVDSHEVGMRKPNPAIYQLALARLGVSAEATAFLDDLAANVAAATRLGMIGIVVDEDPLAAVLEVRRLAGI